LEDQLLLELSAPYLRLFSFCDYTIPQPQGFVYSQICQRCSERFVQFQACRSGQKMV